MAVGSWIVIAVALSIPLLFAVRVLDFYNPAMPSCGGGGGGGERRSCHILLTGASSGIGKAAALTLAKAGYTVHAGVRKMGDAKAIEALDSRIHAVLLDVGNFSNVDEVVDALPKPLYGLINNAGVGSPTVFEGFTDFEQLLQVNLVAPMYLTQKVMGDMRKNRVGRIVNIGSVQCELHLPKSIPYGVSKAGLRAFSDGLRREVRQFGIHVSTIQPGYVATSLTDSALPSMIQLNQKYSRDASMADYLDFYSEEALQKFQYEFDLTKGSMEETTNDILHAVSSPRPHPYYTQSVVKFLLLILHVVPVQVVDFIIG